MRQMSFTRRTLLSRFGYSIFLIPAMRSLLKAANEQVGAAIPCLLPRDSDGLQFVVYADCCSGRFATSNERNFVLVNEVVQRLDPQPQFIVFPGDHILGEVAKDAEELRAQWDYWLKKEMAWFWKRNIPIYHTTSNHNTFSKESERVFREVFPEIPRNGPPGQEGLSYYVRRGALLLVCINTNYSGIGGHGHVEHQWLDQVLGQHHDAKYKLVTGHFPIFPVNGYDLYPRWRVVPDEGRSFWEVLVKHRVLAYLCSHIIAFDVQLHEGVLQLCTGGAGTEAGPSAAKLAMPGTTEFLHIVQMALDSSGLRSQVIDTSGRRREGFALPIPELPIRPWDEIGARGNEALAGGWNRRNGSDSKTCVAIWRFSGRLGEKVDQSECQTLLCGWDPFETAASVWICLEGNSPRLVVRLLPESGGGAQVWAGPSFAPNSPFSFDLVLHKAMGPGGILYRKDAAGPLSSLSSNSSKGAENLIWPKSWAVGHAQSGPTDRPFAGKDLKVQHGITVVDLSL